MIYKHNYQRIALDTDRMMITQCGNDYHDYSKDKLACIYVRWAEEHCPERLQEETNKGRIYVQIFHFSFTHSVIRSSIWT